MHHGPSSEHRCWRLGMVWWLGNYFFTFEMAYFQVRTVRFGERLHIPWNVKGWWLATWIIYSYLFLSNVEGSICLPCCTSLHPLGRTSFKRVSRLTARFTLQLYPHQKSFFLNQMYKAAKFMVDWLGERMFVRHSALDDLERELFNSFSNLQCRRTCDHIDPGACWNDFPNTSVWFSELPLHWFRDFNYSMIHDLRCVILEFKIL